MVQPLELSRVFTDSDSTTAERVAAGFIFKMLEDQGNHDLWLQLKKTIGISLIRTQVVTSGLDPNLVRSTQEKVNSIHFPHCSQKH